MKWLAALKRAGIKHFLGFAVGAWSSMFVTEVKAKAEVEVKVEDRGSNLRVEVVSLFLYSKRGCELPEKMCYKRRLKDCTEEAVSNDDSREILNWRDSKTEL